jgi:hypothetical protein
MNKEELKEILRPVIEQTWYGIRYENPIEFQIEHIATELINILDKTVKATLNELNFTAHQRVQLLNTNGWSKNEIRQLIRDCEKLELQLKQFSC